MFNCGEGTSRLMLDTRVGFKATQAIFATRLAPEAIGGLTGHIISTASSGGNSIRIVGPVGLKRIMAGARAFFSDVLLYSTKLELPISECSNSKDDEDLSRPIFKDSNTAMHAVFVDPSPNPSLLVPSFDSHERDEHVQNVLRLYPQDAPSHLKGNIARDWVDLIFNKSFGERESSEYLKRKLKYLTPLFKRHFWAAPLPETPISKGAISYIGISRTFRGKFDSEKAKTLGVYDHQLFRKLVKEGSIVVDGNVITEAMCMHAPEPSKSFIVVDCPSKEFIKPLISSPQFANLGQKALAGDVHVHVIVHLLGPDVLEDKEYRDWMHTWGDHVHHLIDRPITGKGNTPISFSSSSLAQLRLHYLDKALFPLPRFSLVNPEHHIHSFYLPLRAAPITKSLVFNMRTLSDPYVPSNAIQNREATFYKRAKALERNGNTALSDDEWEMIYKLQEFVEAASEKQPRNFAGEDVTIIPLGTGSAVPGRYRNASSILLRAPNAGNILFDVGEGTWGQLARHYGTDREAGENVWDVLEDLKIIFISHIHGDHILGLGRLLAEIKKLSYKLKHQRKERDPVAIIASDLVKNVLLDFLGKNAFEEVPVRWFAPRDFVSQTTLNAPTLATNLKRGLGFAEINIPPVKHSSPSHGIVLKHHDGWCIAYSGDTMPTDEFANWAQGADVLIHEATFADTEEDRSKATARRHSTISQALEVAKKANATSALLTHFSAAFPKMPPIPEDTFNLHPNFGVATDHAEIKLKDMWKMRHYIRAMEIVYHGEAGVSAEA